MRQTVHVSTHITGEDFAPELWPAGPHKRKAVGIARLEIIDGLSIQSDDPAVFERLAELCRQAAQTLAWFLRRYGGAVEHVGGKFDQLDRLRERLEGAQAAKAA